MGQICARICSKARRGSLPGCVPVKCSKCEGKGFIHTSAVLGHNCEVGERSTGCRACHACGGRGIVVLSEDAALLQHESLNASAIPTAVDAVAEEAAGAAVAAKQAAADAVAEVSARGREAAAVARGAAAQVAAGARAGVKEVAGGAADAASAVAQYCGGMQPCHKCEGKGFSHRTTKGGLYHNTGPTERCFFCADCDACKGLGAIPGTPMGALQARASTSSAAKAESTEWSFGPMACWRCQGKGFCHVGRATHNKGAAERCFFCQDCALCGGLGQVQSAGLGAAGATAVHGV